MLPATPLRQRIEDLSVFRFVARALAGLVLAAAAIAIFALAYALPLSRHPDFVLNSDLLQPFLVAKDALADPSSVLDWVHSPSAYVVPDMLLAALCSLLVPGLVQPLLYGGVLMLLHSLAVGWLLRVAGRTRTVLGGALAMGGVLVAAMLGLSFLPPDVGFNMLVSLPAPFIHTGAILLGISLLAALVAHVTAPSRWSLLPVALLAIAGGYSDTLFTVWFVVPAIIAVMLAGGRFRPRTADLLLVGVLALGSMLIDRYMRPGSTIAIVDHALTLRNWTGGLVTSVQQGLWLFPASVAMGVVMGVRGLYLIAVARQRPISAWNLVEVALGGAQAVAVLAPVVTGTLDVMTNLRYGLAAFMLPMVWVLGLVALRVAASRPILAASAAAVVVLVGALLPASLDAFARDTAPTPLAACLDGQHLTTGYADYWAAKRTMLQTDYRVHLVQIGEDGLPYGFNYNQRWFFRRADTGAPLSPDFVVTSRLKPEVLAPIYGEPDRTLACGDDIVWVYDRPLVLPIELIRRRAGQ